VKSYDYQDAPVQEIFGPTTKQALNLVTCDGVWIPSAKSYSKRLVVFSELVMTLEN
jgi:hypothetical protein